MKSKCDHCNNEIDIEERDINNIYWCLDCTYEDYDLLLKFASNTILPPKDKDPFHFRPFAWVYESSKKVIGSIPKKGKSNSVVWSEKPCKNCNRMNDCGVKKCWNCECLTPC